MRKGVSGGLEVFRKEGEGICISGERLERSDSRESGVESLATGQWPLVSGERDGWRREKVNRGEIKRENTRIFLSKTPKAWGNKSKLEQRAKLEGRVCEGGIIRPKKCVIK